jgi:NDP-sugar pyrophosphorylase family protein
MIPVLGEPLLSHVVKPYLPHVSDIIFVINEPLGTQIKDHFKESYFGHKIFYKVQKEQKGTLDALLTCQDMVGKNEFFCVTNGDDLLKESDIKNAIVARVIGLGVSKKIMPKSYLGIDVENGYIAGFRKHDTTNTSTHVEDLFYNGFNILDSAVFSFKPVMLSNGEIGLPQTLFENLNTYPLKAFSFESWQTVNGPLDMPNAIEFLEKSNN